MAARSFLMLKPYLKIMATSWLSSFFLLTFAAAIPAIVSGGIAERARFYPILIATFFHCRHSISAI